MTAMLAIQVRNLMTPSWIFLYGDEAGRFLKAWQVPADLRPRRIVVEPSLQLHVE